MCPFSLCPKYSFLTRFRDFEPYKYHRKQKRGVIALSIKVKNIKYYNVCKECEFLYHCYGREIAEQIQNDQTDDMYLRPGVCSDFLRIE